MGLAPPQCLKPGDLATLFVPVDPPTSASVHSDQASLMYTPIIPSLYDPPGTPDTAIPRLDQPAIESRAWFSARAGTRRFGGVLEAVAGPLGLLRAVMSELSACVRVLEQAAKNNTEYQKLETELDLLLGDLAAYLKVSRTPALTSRLEETIRELKQQVAVVKEKQDRSLLSHYAGATNGMEDIFERYRSIQRTLVRLAIDAEMSTLKEVTEEAMISRLGRLPDSPAAVWKSAKSASLQRRSCTPETRVDVLSQMHDWAYGDQAETVYWLNGMAGTGKTTIAYSFCDELERTGKLAASFFCSRQLPECRDVSRILPSIAYQLSWYSPAFRFALAEQLKESPNAYNQPLEEQFRDLIARPLIKVERQFLANRVILIDALDECEDRNSVKQLLGVILTCGRGLPVRFIVTSRPEADILDRMRNKETQDERAHTELRLHNLNEDAIRRDIRTYLTAELKRVKTSDAQMDALVKRCGVLFIYAATVARHISEDNYMLADDRLNEVLSSTNSVAEGREQDVDELYKVILKTAFVNAKQRAERRQVLCMVLCAQEPLSIEVIAELLCLRNKTLVAVALRPLHSILRVAEDTGLVTTLHESFPNYMSDRARSYDFCCDFGEQNNIMARQCIRRIRAINPPFNVCHLTSSFLLDDEVPDIQERIKRYIPDSLFYACCHWSAHLSQAEPSAELTSDVEILACARLLVWIEVMNLEECISSAVGGLGQALKWCEARSHTEQANRCPIDSGSPEHYLSTRDLLRDAMQFSIVFSGGAGSGSTPHIYVSGLAYWPKHRPFYGAYCEAFSGLVEMTGTAMRQSWLSLLCTISGQQAVYCAKYSPDGTRIVSGLYDCTVRLWDAHTGQHIGQPLQGHTGTVWSVAYSSDGSQIASGSQDETLRIWNAHTGEQIGQPLLGHTGTIWSVSCSPDGIHIASGSGDQTVRIWDARTGQQIGQPLQGHSSTVWSVSYSPDAAYIASGAGDCAIYIWDAHSRQQPGRLLQGHTSTVWSVAYSPDGEYIASGSDDETVRIWNTHSGQQIGQPLKGHTSAVWSVAYSPDGARLASGSYDCTVRIWDAHTGQQIGQTLQGHTNSVFSVAYSPDGARLRWEYGPELLGVKHP